MPEPREKGVRDVSDSVVSALQELLQLVPVHPYSSSSLASAIRIVTSPSFARVRISSRSTASRLRRFSRRVSRKHPPPFLQLCRRYLDLASSPRPGLLRVSSCAPQINGDMDAAEKLDRMTRCHLKDLKATKIAREADIPSGPETTPAEWATALLEKLAEAQAKPARKPRKRRKTLK